MRGHSSSWIELNRDALKDNIAFLRSTLPADTQLTSVIKGNAYGHGIEAYLPLAEEAGIEFFWTFSSQEAARALAARQNPDTRIGILGHVPKEDLEWVVAEGLHQFVFDEQRLERMGALARRIGRSAPVHLEVETGLYRTGFSAAALGHALESIANSRQSLTLAGLCTHLAGAESFANYLRIQQQLRVFEARCDQTYAAGLGPFLRHAACSAAAFNFPASRLDLVRFGIAQYGFWPSNETSVAWVREDAQRAEKPSPLRRVLSWKSRVLDLTEVPFGEFVGYGNAFQTQRPTRLAVVPVGYATGFPRAQGGRGHVLIAGQRCPVVGTVNMNLLTVDITGLLDVRVGDEVVLIGHQGDQEISVGAFSEHTQAFTYETLVRLDPNLERRVIDRPAKL